MPKDRAMKDVIRAAKPGMVVVMTIQDFREIVEDVAKHLLLLQPIVTMNPTIQIIDPFVQNNEQSGSEKKETESGRE